MAVNWWLDEGLAVLKRQLVEAYPGVVIGSIGDASHASGTSDHNPELGGSEPGADYGEVDAIDPMLGPTFTKDDAQRTVDALVESRDPRIAYIIWNRQIISSTVSPWVWRAYTKDDPHTGHIHVSVNDKFNANTAEWEIGMLSQNDKAWIDALLDAKLAAFNALGDNRSMKGSVKALVTPTGDGFTNPIRRELDIKDADTVPPVTGGKK